MSHDLDELLRERLGEYAAPVVADEHWLGSVVSRLEPVRIRPRRIRFAQASFAATAAAIVAVVVVVAVSLTGDDNARQPLPADPPPTQSPDPGGEVKVDWGYNYLSDPVTFDDMARNLREHGLGEWVEPLHEKWGDFNGQIVMGWDVDYRFTTSIPGTPVSHSPVATVMRESLCFEGSDSCFGQTATELDSGGQRLTLTLGKSGTGPTDGIPGEVYERALYTTVPFNEIPSLAPVELSPGTYQSDPVRFDTIAQSLSDIGFGSSVKPVRQKWGKADGPVQVRLELKGDTATLSIPGSPITVSGRYTTDGSLIRIEDDNSQDDDGWIELAMSLYDPDQGAFYFIKIWDAGPAAWDGLPAEVVAKAYLLFPRSFTPTGE